MSAREEWDIWCDKFIEKITQIVKSEGIKCEHRGLDTTLTMHEDYIVCAKTITNIISGSQEYVNLVKKRQKGKARPVSIGQIYEAASPSSRDIKSD